MRRLTIALLLVVTACGGGEESPSATTTWEAAHTSTQWWMSVAATSAADQWIVGGTTTDGAILRFDGTAVTEVEHGADVGLLNWVHRFDDGSLFWFELPFTEVPGDQMPEDRNARLEGEPVDAWLFLGSRRPRGQDEQQADQEDAHASMVRRGRAQRQST